MKRYWRIYTTSARSALPSGLMCARLKPSLIVIVPGWRTGLTLIGLWPGTGTTKILEMMSGNEPVLLTGVTVNCWPGVTVSDTSNEIFAGVVLGYPEGVCPYSNPPQIRIGALVLPIDPRPLALALSSRTANPFWLYTANASGSVTALELQLYHDPENGDSIAPIGLFQLPLGECPSAIVFRDPALEACMVQYYGDPPGPHPDDYCEEHPYDQWCLRFLEPKPGLQ